MNLKSRAPLPSTMELLHNRTIQIALGIVGLILLGSLAYYLIESTPPKVAYATATTGNLTEDVTATGTVSPIQNPALSFEVSGQVRSLSATVGQTVHAGALLASLDTAVLSANLRAAKAQLNLLQAGPRSVDIAGQKTGVLNAQQTLSNLYTNYPQTLTTTFSQAEASVYTKVDPLFNPSQVNDVALYLSTKNNTTKITADFERNEVTTLFETWQSELSAAGPSPSPVQLQTLTQSSIAHLNTIRTFLNDLTLAINDAEVGAAFTQTQQTTALSGVASARDTINGLITALTAATQSVTNAQLAVQSANDQLNLSVAGATTQSIQAQEAQVASLSAQIRQLEIIAPFNGTIGSVSVKVGDAANANTPVMTLIPNGTFEVDVYLAENQLAGLKVGEPSAVTLDAYGAGKLFPATVSSIDRSPSTNPATASGNANSGSPTTATGYKVTLLFTNPDPAISNGMHANAVIHAGSVQGVVLVPKSAVITDGVQSFVLQKTHAGLVKVPVSVGLADMSSVQIVTGIVAGDTVSAVGAQ